MTTDTKTRMATAPFARLKSEVEVDAAYRRATDPETPMRDAVPLLCAILGVRPGRPNAKRVLEAALTAMGDTDGAARAKQFAEQAMLDHPSLQRAASALAERRPADADAALRPFLEEHPEDPVAMRLMANAMEMAGRHGDAEMLLRRVVAIAPDFAAARRNLADVLIVARKHDAALDQFDALISAEPMSIDHRAARAAILKRMRRGGAAIAELEGLVAEHPNNSELRIDLGNALRTDGQGEAAIAALRETTRRDPSAGRAWYALADLKTVRFDAVDIAAMRDALTADDLPHRSREALHFALARALEQAGEHRDSFAHYALANAFHRATETYDPRRVEGILPRSRGVIEAGFAGFTPDRPSGAIFIVGMPRSGSTLVEQILASHPEIAATEELPYLRVLANDLFRTAPRAYPEGLGELTAEQRAVMRARYLGEARSHCPPDARWFIDKAPANWQHIALIEALLPDARIIDVRRDAMDCGFSNYAQRFGRGNDFAYSLATIGHYQRHYVRFMDFIDAARPGRVHRVDYEALVGDPEPHVRALLDHVGVGFDPACLDFHERTGPVYSASSEQVRRPINREGIGRARPFDAWLGPLKAALVGDATEHGTAT